MPKPGLETQQKIAEIEAEQRRLKALLDKQMWVLERIENGTFSDSTPYISYKKGTSVLDLAGPPGGVRAAFKSEIAHIRQQLEELRRESTTVRRHGYQEYVRRERAAVARIDRQFEAHAKRVLRDAARRGQLTDAELGGLQKGADEILEAFTVLLQLDTSESAIKDVLGQLADVMALDGGDPEVARRALDGVGQAAKGNLDKASKAMKVKPTKSNVRAVIRAAANLQMLNDTADTSAALQQTVEWMEGQRDEAEKQFRHLPSAENLKIMFQAELSCQQMGGGPIASPPKGLKRVKAGESHKIVSGDTLSGISKVYYGTFSYWDVLVRANAQLWANPDKPPTGTIAVPFP